MWKLVTILFIPVMCYNSLLYVNPNQDVDKIDASNTSLIKNSCISYKNKLASAAENVTKCYLMKSRPVRFCEGCIQEFLNYKTLYKDLLENRSKNHNRPSCFISLLYFDRVQVIHQTDNYIRQIWNISFCANCFDASFRNLSNDTIHFKKLYNATIQCFLKYTNAELSFPESFDFIMNVTFNKTACEECESVYFELNKYYGRLEKYLDTKVCMDIVDSMNATRRLWSHSFKCNRIIPKWWWACWPLVTACVITTAFYLLAIFCCRTQRTTAVYKQKRLRPVAYTGNYQSFPCTGEASTSSILPQGTIIPASN